jgi:NADH-quinone oxidoreductase subunit L
MSSHTVLIVAVLATASPLVACGVILLLTRRWARLSCVVSLTAAAASLAGAVWLLIAIAKGGAPVAFGARWLISGETAVTFGYRLDALSALMLVIVAAISFLVQYYSLGYMAHDPGKARYFGFLSLFAWAMLNLTASATLLQLYIFWELVGLSSYLLIGFWFEKFSASEAGKKAFVMTRVGDVTFFLGILLLLFHGGSLDIAALNDTGAMGAMPPAVVTWSALLILGGIVGKSAQFPLMTWLPDAMEGPTPVSALLHSATMVAAGVYLLARLFPFFSFSPTALAAALLIGTLSLLLASTMALVSRDIKQVWAYSTISQLGFMLMGLGAGGYTEGVFHLTTHAGFKALLFLCAGVFIHTFESNDMFEIGHAGGRRLKIPMLCMTIGALALSGLPPFSGFFSKEAVLGRLAAMPNPIWLAAGLFGAFLTTYYTFRLIFIIWSSVQGEQGLSTSAHHHEAGNYRIMALPLLVLAGVTLVLGFFGDRIGAMLTGHGEAHHGPVWLPYAALSIAVAGLALAWYEFGRRDAARIGFVERIPALADFFGRRWYLDRLYRWLLDHVVYRGLSTICAQGDRKVIDGALDGLAGGTTGSGRLLGLLHVGTIQFRVAILFVSMALMAVYLLVR